MTQQAAKPEQWTDEQWQAIIRKGNNLLVAAAAGSGKTSVLVERIIRKVTDTAEPIGVDELLVLTFTNAAAAEMRHRIGEALRKAIEQDPQSAHLRRQLTLLQRATITTLHSFCLELLRQYYYMVDLDPDFRIADPMETELLRQDVLEAKLEEWYEQDPDFQALADRMVDGQDDAALQSLLLRIYDFSRSHPRPSAWLSEVAAAFEVEETTPLESLPWTRSILRAIRLELQALTSMLTKAIGFASSPEGPNAYVPVLEVEQLAVQAAAQAAGQGWEPLRLALSAIQFQRLPAVKDADPLVKEQVQGLRDSVKKRLKALEEEYFNTAAAEYLRDLANMAPHMKTLVRLVDEYEEAYRKEKRARSLVDFGDLEHVALQILIQRDEDGTTLPSEVASSLRARFAEVLVDEYQDINLVQETILQMVSRDGKEAAAANRFMVGDVKQSIYRFRLAEPNLFMQKYQEYETDHDGPDAARAEGLRIDLAANFRSRSEVVDAVNYLFRLIMTPGIGELAYDRAAELICRASYPEVEPERLQAEVHLIDRTAPDAEEGDEGVISTEEPEGVMADAAQTQNLAEEASVAQLEARLIARRIRKWMEPGEGEKPLLVFDKKAGGLRPVAYRDMVILLRATAGWGQVLQEELRAAGIPVYAEQSGGYFAAPEVDLMLSLLRLIDNPLQDIPLAAVLRSPIGNLKEEELAQIRIECPGGSFHQAVVQYMEKDSPDEGLRRKLRGFYARLNRWRTKARQGSLAALLSLIYHETGYMDYVTGMENGHQRRANLRILYDRAKQYEAGSYRGLFRFLRFVDRMQQAGNDLGEARTVSESEDVVRIMTIHKSKGLEFPVVFVAGLGKQFNTMDIKSSFLLHKDLGFGPQVTDPELRLRYPSLAMLGIRQELRRELLAEEMRVLYVALTRAREKLVLVGSAKDLGKSIVQWGHQQTDGDTLADEDLQQAKGFLDWIGRALLRHPSAKPLRTYPMEKGQEAQAISLPLIQDRSQWSFHFYPAAELTGQTEMERSEMAFWEQLVNRELVADRPRDAAMQQVIERALGWEDPHQIAATTAAKWSVSDLKQRHSMDSGMPYRLPRIHQKPHFLSNGNGPSKRFTAAELGTIMHTVMQHLDLSRSLDEADIRQQINKLVDRQYLTQEQADAVQAGQIAAFFASELGQRMKLAPAVYRELPFTLAIPAAEIRTELSAYPDEKIIVQGVIDCMFAEADGRLVLLDFKTDGIAAEPTPEAIEQLRERYGEQLRYYKRAVEEIWKQEVAESYLYLFAGGFSISFPA
ncbi:helicase-exonuclease AddAB subunit AddA [Brevibacillus migulae]|uniref:helicase-exonuclease AddAB subunit AddA n=1 Tax=Brevibacillus migulae TaxID=1644114 RepID=UPI00106E151E|nr:helicase-exonuclease AddAB subunit AddA [Brevibacillus migulae]